MSGQGEAKCPRQRILRLVLLNDWRRPRIARSLRSSICQQLKSAWSCSGDQGE